jgi:hypothetical protein
VSVYKWIVIPVTAHKDLHMLLHTPLAYWPGNSPNVCRRETDVVKVKGGKIKKNVMGWACGADGGGERCAQGVGGEA